MILSPAAPSAAGGPGSADGGRAEGLNGGVPGLWTGH